MHEPFNIHSFWLKPQEIICSAYLFNQSCVGFNFCFDSNRILFNSLFTELFINASLVINVICAEYVDSWSMFQFKHKTVLRRDIFNIWKYPVAAGHLIFSDDFWITLFKICLNKKSRPTNLDFSKSSHFFLLFMQMNLLYGNMRYLFEKKEKARMKHF